MATKKPTKKKVAPRKKSLKNSTKKSAPLKKSSAASPVQMKANVAFTETSLNQLRESIRSFAAEHGLEGMNFTLVQNRPVTTRAAVARTCPPGYHLEIDPDTGDGICVRN